MTEAKRTRLSAYVPDEKNANKGTQRGYGALEQSLRQYGAGRSVLVDKNGKLIAGNKTVEKSVEIGLEDAIEIETDGRQVVVVKRTDLDLDTDPEARALAIADNRVGELSLEWDAGVLAGLQDDGVDLSGQFTADEMAALLEQVEVVAGDGGEDFDATPEEGPTRTALGDLWLIRSPDGREHRLLVGDCTDPANVERLMGEERADMVGNDPPYGSTGCAWDTVIPFEEMWSLYAAYVKADAAIVLTASQPFTSALIASNFEWFKHCWVWNKKLAGNFLLADRQPMKIHEDVCVFSQGTYHYHPQMRTGVMRLKGGNGKSKLWDMDLTGSVNDTYYPVSIIEIGNTDRANIEHPTQKPVELFEYLIGTYSRKGDIVLDNTLGSGTALVAAHRTHRRCYGMEISPRYADVILRRAEAEGLTCERVEP